MAKRQYKYVFKGKEKARLHEFLAYAVTNKQMIDFLKTQPRPVREGLLGKLLDLVINIIDTLKEAMGQKVYRNKSGSAFMEMVAATEHLVALQAKHESSLKKFSNKTYNSLDASDEWIRQFAEDMAVKFTKRPGQARHSLDKTISTVAGGLHTIFADTKETRRVREFVNGALNKTLRGLSAEIGSGVLTEEMIEQLLNVKVTISKARQQAETFTTK